MNKVLRCGMCKRVLKNEKSQRLGFGSICYKKWIQMQGNKTKPLFELDNNKK